MKIWSKKGDRPNRVSLAQFGKPGTMDNYDTLILFLSGVFTTICGGFVGYTAAIIGIIRLLHKNDLKVKDGKIISTKDTK